ncbi:MAG: hypothetical protein RLZZ387_1582 [Chloroflexota bacterium]
MNPLVSIVMPHYNGAPYLRIALESALAQTYRPLEVVMVDDGSTDESLATVADLIDAGRVRLVRQENGGVAAARNACVAHSAGEYLVFLDNDDVLAPTMVERLMTLVDRADPAVFAYCDYVRIDTAGEKLPDSRSLRGARTKMEGNLLAPLLLGAFLLPVCVLMSRQLIAAAGGVRLRFSPIDDYDLWLCASCHGGVARYLDEPLAFYRQRPGSQSTNQELMLRRERELLRAIAADYPVQVAAAMPDVLWEFRDSAAQLWRDGAERLAEATQYARSLEEALAARERELSEAARYARSLEVVAREAEAYAVSLEAELRAGRVSPRARRESGTNA